MFLYPIGIVGIPPYPRSTIRISATGPMLRPWRGGSAGRNIGGHFIGRNETMEHSVSVFKADGSLVSRRTFASGELAFAFWFACELEEGGFASLD